MIERNDTSVGFVSCFAFLSDLVSLLFHVSFGLDVVTAFHPSLSWMLVIMVVKEMILRAAKFSLAFSFAIFEQMDTLSTIFRMAGYSKAAIKSVPLEQVFSCRAFISLNC